MSIEPNLEKIITILSDCKFHDGSSIGKQLGITRAGVWKIIQKLLSYGIEIKSVKGKGYLLSEPLILLSTKKISAPQSNILIEVFESIPSTKDYLQPYHETNTFFKKVQPETRGAMCTKTYMSDEQRRDELFSKGYKMAGGVPGGNRTHDNSIKSRVLYRLSYGHIISSLFKLLML